MGKMTRAHTDELLREPHISIITTLRPDGTPHMTPVWHLFDGDRVIVSVEESSVKARNVRHDPRVALCVATPESPQRWASVTGTAVLSKEGVAEAVRAVSVLYMGAAEGEPYAEQVLADLDFILISITPTWVMGWDGQD